MASNATLLATATLMSVVVSCATPYEAVELSDTELIHIKDSVIFRDSIILVPVPQGEDKAKLPDTDTSFLRTSVAESEAFVKDGVLHHSLTNRAEAVIPIRVTIPTKLHSEERGLTRYLKQVERVEMEKELSRWQRFIQGLGYAVLIAGALWLAWKLAKIVRPFS